MVFDVELVNYTFAVCHRYRIRLTFDYNVQYNLMPQQHQPYLVTYYTYL